MGSRPLFERYPRLRGGVPHRELGPMHTSVGRLGRLSKHVGAEIWIKRDDLCADPYGGNKTRKLEFLLGHALETGARSVVTFGYAGSNHCLATTVHGRRLGLEVASHLLHLPGWSARGPSTGASRYDARVGRNIASIARLGGRQYVASTRAGLGAVTLARTLEGVARHGRRPLVIPAGGSAPTGILGYVNAGIELVEQILAAQLPKPTKIFVPFGSAGTCAGMALGLALAGMPVPIVPIAVVPSSVSDAATLERAFAATLDMMRRIDRGVPRVKPRWLPIDDGQIGVAYGDATFAAQSAVRLLRELEGLVLEPSYGGKAMAGLLEQVRKNQASGPLLFWHTYDAREPPDGCREATVPRALAPYVAASRAAKTASP